MQRIQVLDFFTQDHPPEPQECSRLLKELRQHGFANVEEREAVRRGVGRYLVEFSEYDMSGDASRWNFASLLTCLCLRSMDRAPPMQTPEVPATLPSEWQVIPPDQRWGVRDFHDTILGIAASWRHLRGLNQAHWTAVRVLEHIMSDLMRDHLWPDGDVEDCCQIMAVLWGVEFLVSSVAANGVQRIDMDDERLHAAEEWVEKQKANAVRSNSTQTMMQPLLKMELRMGENERYARSKGGISAKNLRSVFGDTRTHVQATVVKNGTKELDLRLANGGAVMLLVDNAIRGSCGLPWLTQAVVSDLEMLSDTAIETTEARQVPWILQLAGEWLVVTPHAVWSTPTAIVAILHWFDEFKALRGPEYIFDLGMGQAYDLSILIDDSEFPFSA